MGIGILTGGLEGYLLKVGRLEMWARVLFVLGGFLVAFPGYEQFPWWLSWWMSSIIGIGLTIVVIAIVWIQKKTPVKLITSE